MLLHFALSTFGLGKFCYRKCVLSIKNATYTQFCCYLFILFTHKRILYALDTILLKGKVKRDVKQLTSNSSSGQGAQIPVCCSLIVVFSCLNMSTIGSEMNIRNLCSQVKLQITCFEVGVAQ